MIQGKQILFIVVALAVLGLGATLGYGTGVEKGRQGESKKIDTMLTKFTLLPRLESITVWRTTIGGVVKVVSRQSITIETGENLSELFFDANVAVEKNFVRDGNVVRNVKDLRVNDIKEGETVTIAIAASLQGDLTVKKVTILTPQQ